MDSRVGSGGPVPNKPLTMLAVNVGEFDLNKLKTTPTPNKNGSYGIKGGSYAWYAIKVGVRMP